MTRQEKLAVYFLIGLLVLGFAVKFYKSRAGAVSLKVERSSLNLAGADIGKIVKEKGCVKINTAGAEDFARLPGIGPGLAARIVEYRIQNGNFLIKEDLKKVKGIGDKKYEQIKDYLVIE